MSAVATCSLGVKAWYQATQSAGTISGSQSTSQLATGSSTVATNANFSVTVAVDELSNDSIVMAGYNSGWFTKYYDTGLSSAQNAALGDNQVFAKAYSIKLTLVNDEDTSGYTDAQALQLIKEAGITISVTAATNLVDDNPATTDADETVVNPLASRTKIWASESAMEDADESSDPAPDETSGANVLTLTNGTHEVNSVDTPDHEAFYNWNGSETIMGYFMYYIDGASTSNDGVYNVSSNNLKTKIVVTVSKQG